ncbi:MAG TPA: hypothetical protein GXZ80_02730 [Euryarchaeota archaeon]|nr:hypothetical protein [Euryarchaeota archaeon]HOB37914.1 hypothetical protein [Methanomassiliicoccaceae archaeon]HQD87626.1 hypothetical protein [Methanomassiliicoccaceae archaeon]
MRTSEIMGMSARFIEPSFDALVDESFTGIILTLPAQEARLVVDEEDWPLALAVRDGEAWNAASFLLRPPIIEVIERFEELGGDVVHTTQDEFMLAMREYYSLHILNNTLMAMEDLSPDRTAKVEELIASVWKGRRGEECMDCGCGSGMGSLALRNQGIIPLAFDNDAGLIARGLHEGRLIPERTMCIDATLLSHYARQVPLGLALMAGSIIDQTAMMWRAILEELFSMTRETLITVETEKEANMVRTWALENEKNVEMFENERDPFYDRWVCLVKD